MNKKFYKKKPPEKIFFVPGIKMKTYAIGEKVHKEFIEWRKQYIDKWNSQVSRFYLNESGSIDGNAAKINKVQDVLIELHVAQEDSKQGFTPEEAIEMLSDEFIAMHPHIRICGVMGMASLTDDEAKIRSEFKAIKATFERLRDEIFDGCDYFCEISMGMSGDYPIAIEEGATIVRIGSSIFGNRNY